jgi:hypothetical protein
VIALSSFCIGYYGTGISKPSFPVESVLLIVSSGTGQYPYVRIVIGGNAQKFACLNLCFWYERNNVPFAPYVEGAELIRNLLAHGHVIGICLVCILAPFAVERIAVKAI